MEQQRQGHNQRLAKIEVQADMSNTKALYAYANRPSSVKWVEALCASVHPLITYAFFLLFASVKIVVLFRLLNYGHDFTTGLITVWDGKTQTLFAAVMAFWFGQRALAKMRLK